MTYELYINGVRCDLSTDSEIALLYKSPIFADLDSIQSNRSYNIDLPITAKNRRAVGLAMRTDVSSRTPYRKLPAKLYAGGIPLFTTGFAIITGISDVISITLVWGNIDNFQPLFDTELPELADPLYEMGIGSIPWNNDTVWESVDGEDLAFYRFDSGVWNSTNDYIRPSVSVKAIIQAIEKKTGINFMFPSDNNPQNDNLYIPLLTTNGDSREQYPNIRVSTFGTNINGQFLFNPLLTTNYTKTTIDNDGNYSRIDTSGIDHLQIAMYGIDIGNEFIVELTKQITTVTDPNTGGTVEVLMPIPDNFRTLNIGIFGSKFKNATDERAVLLKNFQSYKFTDGDYHGYVHFMPVDLHIDVSEWENITFQIGSVDAQGTMGVYNPLFKSWMLISSDEFELVARIPCNYPVAVNLPDMTCGDFIQNLMTMYGLFAGASLSNDNTIRFMSADQLYYNKEEGAIYDWTRKVMCNNRRDAASPDSIEYSIDDWAQVNTLNYDNDKEIEADTSGEILIDNRNIEEENEITVDFSASENKTRAVSGTVNADVAVVPIYEATPRDDGSFDIRYQSVTDRILHLVTDSFMEPDPDLTRLIFPEWLRFGGRSGIVNRYYISLQRLLTDMKIVTVRARLSPGELSRLDYTKPVYLGNLGAYFAIYEITAGTNGICECKLIKM